MSFNKALQGFRDNIFGVMFVLGIILIFASFFVGCNDKDRAYATATIGTVDTSVDGVTISFYDSLSDADRAILVNEIRQEVIAWETEEDDKVVNVNVEVVVNNNITTEVEVELVPSEIVIACKRPFRIPRGRLHGHLCKWHKKKCKRNED